MWTYNAYCRGGADWTLPRQSLHPQKCRAKQPEKQDMSPCAQEQDMSVQYETDDEEFGESMDVKVVDDDIYYETDEEEFNPGASSNGPAAHKEEEEDDENGEGVGLVGTQYETDEEEFKERASQGCKNISTFLTPTAAFYTFLQTL